MAVRLVWDQDVARSSRVIPTVAVAQLVEHRIVVPNVVGSNPIGHLIDAS